MKTNFKFKNQLIAFAYVLLVCVFSSCKKDVEEYPKYSLETIKYIPDTLKVKHREWIKETVRATNQHLSAGDYEDVDQTIIQAKWTADELFETTVVGLRKEINDNHRDDLSLTPDKLNVYEKHILDSLTNAH